MYQDPKSWVLSPASKSTQKHPLNGDTSDNTVKSDGELSPASLRRSTRACALKAQEKLKFKDLTVIDSGMVENGNFPGRSVEHDDDVVSGAPKKKKPKLNDGNHLDQYDCKFGIRMDEDGDVVMMSDESEISSLNAEEVSDLRNLYNDFKKHRVSDEQRRLREQQISELEAALRLEEAKLAMLKKIRQCQQQNAKIVKTENVKPLTTPNVVQNTAGNAYKPTIATPPAKMNGTSNKTNKVPKNATQNMISALAGMTPQQQQQLLQNLAQNPMLASQAQHITAVLEALKQQQQSKQTSQQATPATKEQTSTPAATKPVMASSTATPESARAGLNLSGNSQQRAAAARLALRREIEKQLLQIPQPKAPVVELNFIPNGAQPDFCSLLGLDLTVQRVLKDKNVFKRVEVPPYECEECGTDFTPCWKAIGTSENDLHLYCEQCVKQAQKRKMKNDHTAVYKKVFQKISEREKELEKQISAGKFDDPVPPPPAPTNTTPSAKVATATATPISAATNHTASPATPASATAHVKSTPSTSTQPQIKPTPNVTPKQKRPQPTSGATGNTSANNAQSATNVMAAFQQQLATLTALRQSNPMLAAMFAAQSNPLLFQAQMWNPMLAAAAAARPNMASNNSVNPAAMLALLQAAAQSQQQQQRSTTTTTSTTNAPSTTHTSSSNASNAAAAFAQQAHQQQGLLAALAALTPGANAQNLNPQIMRQLQQLQQSAAKMAKK
uniref:Transcriptional repressor p66 coiled-coil MBD2-interaction domain-containing protein n=1 Tax=Acrobeloides nanus TaxID=290746 RepID=A0A914EJQ1_9BILA